MDWECLIVDDDTIVLRIHQRIVIKEGFHPNPKVFENGQSAFDYLRGQSVEGYRAVVLLDINMPVMDGWEFLNSLEELKSKCEIKVFMVTSSSDQIDKDRAFAYAQVVGYFEKPLLRSRVAELREHDVIRELSPRIGF